MGGALSVFLRYRLNLLDSGTERAGERQSR